MKVRVSFRCGSMFNVRIRFWAGLMSRVRFKASVSCYFKSLFSSMDIVSDNFYVIARIRVNARFRVRVKIRSRDRFRLRAVFRTKVISTASVKVGSNVNAPIKSLGESEV